MQSLEVKPILEPHRAAIAGLSILQLLKFMLFDESK